MASKIAMACCLIALQSGCGGPSDDAEQGLGGSAGSNPGLDAGVDARTDSGADKQTDGDAAPLLPNNIRFTTCETEPQEVAVPNGANKGTCDRVTAKAYHVNDDQTAVEIPSSFAWTVDDSAVAFFAPPQDTDTGETRRLLSLIDIFTAPSTEEPWANLQACALPLNGTGQVEPICGTLAIHAVVNLSGTWCFQGETFQGDCDKRQIDQDGRRLTSSTLGQGKVQGRLVDFFGSGPTYQAELSDPDHMAGKVYDQNTQQALGQWSAKRDNLAQ